MKWRELSAWLAERRDIWIDVLRIYLGIGLFVRGMIFFINGGQVMFRSFEGGEGMEWFTWGVVGHYVILAHLCGGIMLAFGLLTRVAALINVPVLIGAVALHSADGIFALGQSLEFAAFVLVTLLFIAIAGPGRLSVDHYTFGRVSSNHHEDHLTPTQSVKFPGH